MDIYNIAKYQNIADRIKRLASFNKTHTQPSEIVSPRYGTRQPVNFYSRNLVTPTELTARLKYEEKQSQSRMPTQETEQKSQQHSMSFINELMAMRQTRPSRTFSRQKILKNTKVLDQETKNNSKMEGRNIYRRNLETQTPIDQAKPSMSKIKSQNSLKIDEILSNYNSYKQNKQQFLQSINRTPNIEAHQRIVSQNLANFADNPDKSRTEQRKSKSKDMVFEQIDNIWNEKSNEDEVVPKFMRSKPEKKDQFAQLTDLLNSELQQKTKVDPKSQIYGRAKLVIRREDQKKQNDNNQQIPKMNALMSPRGMRAPGKICKNNDKSFGVLPKYK